MDNAMLIGLSRQITLRRAMDITANNIANANTTGFKAEQILLEENPYTPARHQDGPRRLQYNDEWGVGRDFSQGPLTPTGRPLDFALEGEGFFTIETDAGVRYTRDGAFTLNAQGELVASDGARVLDEGGSPILLDPEGGPISVTVDGELAQNNAPIARLGVVTFEDLGVLEKVGSNRLRLPEGEGAEPQPMTDTKILQGMTESSNVQPIMELTRMMEVSRAYQSVTRMIQQTDELNRRAIERLGRA
ncbi:flagellar basal-body rod protein FlgF [Woodsholea maritima]|uniref:flagellar basal-body rod protein FlgF n=1 Tax=Woodsholea maritima TaxID=240237 RepID=UPI000476D6F6|nr:flagellar basal-body rod protein FlgF [Woodsholea maritima]